MKLEESIKVIITEQLAMREARAATAGLEAAHKFFRLQSTEKTMQGLITHGLLGLKYDRRDIETAKIDIAKLLDMILDLSEYSEDGQ